MRCDIARTRNLQQSGRCESIAGIVQATVRQCIGEPAVPRHRYRWLNLRQSTKWWKGKNLVKETRVQANVPGSQQKTVISRIAWHVDEERTIRIRKDTDEILSSLNRLGSVRDSRFLALPFRRNLSAHFIHQIT
jgi:hypothetical protein